MFDDNSNNYIIGTTTTMAVQTRCCGDIVHYPSVKEAREAWLINPGIEKISWSDETGQPQLWRPQVKGVNNYGIEEILCSLSANYTDAEDGSNWWYMQPLGYDPVEVISDKTFENRFCQ